MVTDLEPDGTEGRVTKTDDDDDDDDDDVQQLSTKSTSYFLLPYYYFSSSSNVFLKKRGTCLLKLSWWRGEGWDVMMMMRSGRIGWILE